MSTDRVSPNQVAAFASQLLEDGTDRTFARAIGAFLTSCGAQRVRIERRVAGSTTTLLARGAPGSARTGSDTPVSHERLTVRGHRNRNPRDAVSCEITFPSPSPLDATLTTLLRRALARVLEAGRQQRLTRATEALGQPDRYVFLLDADGQLIDREPQGLRPPPDLLDAAAGRNTADPFHVRWNGAEHEVRGVRLSDAGRPNSLLCIESRPRRPLRSMLLHQLEGYRLTRRESEVAGMLVEGWSNRDIAAQLFVSLDTVKTHCRHVFAKLDVRRRGQMIRALGGDTDREPLPTSQPPRAAGGVGFGKRPPVPALWRDRLVRFDTGPMFFENTVDGSKVRIEQGAIGYCYEAGTSLSIGLNRRQTAPLVQPGRYERFEICVSVAAWNVPFLSVSLD